MQAGYLLGAGCPGFELQVDQGRSAGCELTGYHLFYQSYGVFTPEQDNDKTMARQMLNLCIPMMPFTPDWCQRHHRNAHVQHLSCRCLVVVWCENTIRLTNSQNLKHISTAPVILHFLNVPERSI